MKISPKVLVIAIYVALTFIITAAIQGSPVFLAVIDSLTLQIQDLGALGMFIYTIISALLMAFAIPLQFIDLVVGIIYPL